MKKTSLKSLLVKDLVLLKRNPQFLTPKQMDSLKRSIERDGFCVPILVRPMTPGKYEVISGNHRFMAASELGLKEISCVVSRMSDRDSKRMAINLNSIHGNANVELLAPFLAEMDDALLTECHIEDAMMDDLIKFDAMLAERLAKLEPIEKINRASPKHKNIICNCPICGRKHFK